LYCDLVGRLSVKKRREGKTADPAVSMASLGGEKERGGREGKGSRVIEHKKGPPRRFSGWLFQDSSFKGERKRKKGKKIC